MKKSVLNHVLVLLVAVLMLSALLLPAFATQADDLAATAETAATASGSGALNVVKYVVIVLDALVAVALILVVLFQSGKSEGLGAIAGNSGSFVSKTGSKTLDAKLARSTKWIGLVFVFLTLISVILISMTK